MAGLLLPCRAHHSLRQSGRLAHQSLPLYFRMASFLLYLLPQEPGVQLLFSVQLVLLCGDVRQTGDGALGESLPQGKIRGQSKTVNRYPVFSLHLTGRKTLLLSIDFFIVELTTLLAFWIMATRAGWLFDGTYLLNNIGWFVFLPALWFFSAFLNDLYAPKTSGDLAASTSSLFSSIVLVILVYFGIYFFATTGEMPRGIVGYQGAASFVFIMLWRAVYISLIQYPPFARKVIIVGAGQAGQTIAQIICQYRSRALQHPGARGRRSRQTKHPHQWSGCTTVCYRHLVRFAASGQRTRYTRSDSGGVPQYRGFTFSVTVGM